MLHHRRTAKEPQSRKTTYCLDFINLQCPAQANPWGQKVDQWCKGLGKGEEEGRR